MIMMIDDGDDGDDYGLPANHDYGDHDSWWSWWLLSPWQRWSWSWWQRWRPHRSEPPTPWSQRRRGLLSEVGHHCRNKMSCKYRHRQRHTDLETDTNNLNQLAFLKQTKRHRNSEYGTEKTRKTYISTLISKGQAGWWFSL